MQYFYVYMSNISNSLRSSLSSIIGSDVIDRLDDNEAFIAALSDENLVTVGNEDDAKELSNRELQEIKQQLESLVEKSPDLAKDLNFAIHEIESKIFTLEDNVRPDVKKFLDSHETNIENLIENFSDLSMDEQRSIVKYYYMNDDYTMISALFKTLDTTDGVVLISEVASYDL